MERTGLSPARAVLARALAYWAGVFAAGAVLGTARTLLLAPAVGVLTATALELPVMLGASWWWAGRIMARAPIAGRAAALRVGALAFALLMVSEAALAVLIGAGLSGWAAGLATPPGTLGLAGQVGFALCPWLRASRSR